jgi:CARDB protein
MFSLRRSRRSRRTYSLGLERLERRLLLAGGADLYDDGDSWSSFSPDSVVPGQPWDCQWSVRNGGTEAASGFRVDFYASTNSSISQGDNFLGAVWVGGVAAGAYIDIELPLESFPHLSSGYYYVGVIIDPTNLVIESSEINNTGVDRNDYPLYVAPFVFDDAYEENDFAGEASTPAADWEDQLLGTIDGLGVQRDDDWYEIVIDSERAELELRVGFIHHDGDIDMDLYREGELAQPVAVAETSDDVESILIELDAGTYLVRIHGDNAGNTYDMYWRTESVGVDLAGTAFNVPAAMGPSDTFTVTWDTTNDGPSRSGTFWWEFVISTDTTLGDASDKTIGTWATTGLAPEASWSWVYELTLPAEHDPWWSGDGIYYIGVIADSTQLIDELDEANNSSLGNGLDYDAVAITLDRGPLVANFIGPDEQSVAVLDMDGTPDIEPDDVNVLFGPNGSVTMISIGSWGAGAMGGLGIVVSNASNVGLVLDLRSGGAPLAFLASEAPVGVLILNSGIAGYDINDQTLGGMAMPVDVDGDALLHDATAVYVPNTLGVCVIGGAVTGDVVCGTGAGAALTLMLTRGGGMTGDLDLNGYAGPILLDGDYTGRVKAAQGLGFVSVSGNVANSQWNVSRSLSFVSVTGNITNSQWNVSGSLGVVSVGGSVADSQWGVSGSLTFASVMGSISNSDWDVTGHTGYVSIGGAWTDTSLTSTTLGFVSVRGAVGATAPNVHQIHATAGTFILAADGGFHLMNFAFGASVDDMDLNNVRVWVG